jgi:predicted HD phosphohydrolase
MTRSELAALIEALADLPYGGEPVDQRTHALQTAAHAVAAGADDEIVVAAALHDIGRAREVATRYRGMPHESAGAEFASPGRSSSTCRPSATWSRSTRPTTRA